jgi:toxin ParE1/3/4
MAYRVKIMARAKWDLEGIYSRIEAQSSDAARAWYAGLKDGIRRLGDNPNRCPVTTEDVRLRHLLYGNKPHIYRVLYRVVEKHREVDVLHVRHGAQQEFKTGDLN